MFQPGARDDASRACLRAPDGNLPAYSRDYLSLAKQTILRSWSNTTNPQSPSSPASALHCLKREVALILLDDPELRLRVCHLEELLRGRLARQQQMPNGPGNGAGSVPLQSAIADSGFSLLFCLDPAVAEPDWGMQVLWLNMQQLQKELNLGPPASNGAMSLAAPPARGGSPSLAAAAKAQPQQQQQSSGSGAASVSYTASAPLDPSVLLAIDMAFPNHPMDDEEYLAVAACYCLAAKRATVKAPLPANSLLLSELCNHLCTFAAADMRLAGILQRLASMASGPRRGSGGGVNGAAPPQRGAGARAVADLLSSPRLRACFRLSEPPPPARAAKGDRLVSLAVEQLLVRASSSSSPMLGSSPKSPGGAGFMAGLMAGLQQLGNAGLVDTSLLGLPQGPNMMLGNGQQQQQQAALRAMGGAMQGRAGAGLPLDVWERGGLMSASNRPASGGSGGLPSYLFEFEGCPADGCGANDMVSEGDQFEGQGGPGGQSPMAAVRLGAMHFAAANGGAGGGMYLSASVPAPSDVGSALLQMQYSQGWMNGNGGAASPPNGMQRGAAGGRCGLPPTALGANGPMRRIGSGAMLPQCGDTSSGGGNGLGGMGLGLGFGSTWSAATTMTLEGASAGSSLNSNLGCNFRYPLFGDSFFSTPLPGDVSSPGPASSGGPPPPATPSLDPSNPSNAATMHVPKEVASCWSAASATSLGNMGMDRRPSSGPSLDPQGLRTLSALSGFAMLDQGGFRSVLSPGGGSILPSDYSSTWNSSSSPQDLSASASIGVAGLSADDAGAWLPARGMSAGGGVGGFLVSRGGSGGGAAAGGKATAAAGQVGAVNGANSTGTVPSPSISEESDEAASMGGHLELDLAPTLEAIIGYEAPMVLQSGPGSGANGLMAQGIIAAAASPRLPAGSTQQQQQPGGNPNNANGNKSFASVASSHGARAHAQNALGLPPGGSRTSSMDSAEALGAMAAAAAAGQGHGALLSGWSAMAARASSAPAPVAALPGAGSGPPGPRMSMPSIGAIGLGPMGALGAQAAAARPGGPMGQPGALMPSNGPGAAKLLTKLTPRVRDEICQLVRTVPGLKAEDFDDGVLYQLTLKKSEDEAIGALRMLGQEDVSGIQHMAAYINHVIKNYHIGGPGSAGAGGSAASLPSATVRANSTPVSSKAILQKLPLRVYKRLEEVINKCTYMEWKHFDAGVIKVMAQLAEIGEEDVFEELEMLKSTDLSNVEYMPAYLNKRLNNRLWSRRKMAASAGGN